MGIGTGPKLPEFPRSFTVQREQYRAVAGIGDSHSRRRPDGEFVFSRRGKVTLLRIRPDECAGVTGLGPVAHGRCVEVAGGRPKTRRRRGGTAGRVAISPEHGGFHSSADQPARVSVVESGPLRATVEISGTIAGSPFVQRVSIAQGSLIIDCSVRIDWQGNPRIGELARGAESAAHSLIDPGASGWAIPAMFEHNGALMVRLFNASGDDTPRQLGIGFEAVKVELMELDGRVVEKLEPVVGDTEQRSIRLGIPRYGFRTLRFNGVKSSQPE